MHSYLRFIFRTATLLLPVFLSLGLSAQQFIGEPYTVNPPGLDKVLAHWEVYRLDAAGMQKYLTANNHSATLDVQLGSHHWQLDLQPSKLISPKYTYRVSSDQGVETFKRSDQVAFKGIEKNMGGQARLTIDRDFIQGSVFEGSARYYLEPLWYHQPDADRDLFLFYNESDAIPDYDGTCIALASEESANYELPESKHQDAPEMACHELEIAIASDRSMFDKYGSIAAVQNHNIAVLNDVQVDYTGWFTHDIEFVIVTQFVVTGTDPWSNSTNANTLLNSFQTWGQGGNFGTSFDNGELWTNRVFQNGVLGIAWVGGICNGNKYHCLRDWTTNASMLRQTATHELGHNFSANHDTGAGVCPPNFIMCPSVNGSSTWSAASISSINPYMQTRVNNGCLGPCGSSAPLMANFSWDPNPPCMGVPVQFTDLSTGGITSRSWTFQGGSPATSTATNPVVTFTTPGVKNVTLVINGPGGSASTTKQVTVKPAPTANFTHTHTGLTYTFSNSATNAVSYLWDFGDGEASTEPNPQHTYAESGVYTVVLTVENECGTASKTLIINTIPTAAFSASPTSGCATLTVVFSNESSSNATAFQWSFPGGSPSSSGLQNPVVQYNISGTYTVTLTAYNATGSNSATALGYITVQIQPTAQFTHTVNGLTVNFNNNSNNATSTLWNFGDGQTSTATNPSHTYAVGGVYTVTLTSTNACGTATSTQTVSLIVPPTAGFSADTTSGCSGLTVHFASTSTGNPTSFLWSFPGGTPNSSTVSNPTVVYNTAPGSYSVTLTVSNAAGTNTASQPNFITILPPPTAGFNSNVNGATVAFTNSSTNAVSYLWNFGDSQTSTSVNPSHTYANDGTYTVTLTATSPCGTNTFTQTVTIVTPPTANFNATPTSGCGPLTVQFNNTSSANAVNFNWQFPGGSPSSSTAQNPVVVYTAPGTYTVTLTVSNAAGSNTATQTSYITVNAGPTAGFSSSVAGATATFTNSSVNATSYLWNFGDSQTSTAANPSHTYASDGTYTVTLTATGPCGTNTASQTVTIVTPPTANFNATPTSGCGPLTVQFNNASSANAVNFNWQFPGGTPSSSTVANPVVIYTAPGVYSVTLTVSNAAGSSTATQTNYITVNPGPTAGFSSAVNGATATFTNSSTNATSYAWNFGDSQTSTATNPSHTYANDGTYTVTLTATGPCGSNTTTQTVTIVTPPTANFNATPTSGCGPLTVQFNNTSSANAVNFNWQFPGGTPSSSTVENPVVVYDVPGTYTVTLTVSNAAGSNSVTQTSFVTVNPAPTSGFTSSVSGATATFTNTSVNATSYAWNFGDSQTSTAANPSHTYMNDGTYTVTLTATNPCGVSTFTQTVVIITSPNAGFTANVTTGCGPLTVQFQDLSSSNTTSWNWSFPGGTPDTSTEQNPVVVFTTPGQYTVTLVASTAAGSSTYTQTNFITVLAPPTAGFSSSTSAATVTFSNTSQNATSYLWNFGDNSTSSQANPEHTYTADGTYTVTLTATNICGSSTTTGTVTVVLPPQAAITPDVVSGCGPLTVPFTNQSSANATSFEWVFEGGTPPTSTETNPSATWTQPGTYQVTLTAINSAGTSTATASVVVLGPPTAGFTAQTAGLSVVLTNTSTNATSYFWNFGDGQTSTEVSPTHTYLSTGTYTVLLRAQNNCGIVEFTQNVEINGSAPIAMFSAENEAGCAPFTVQFTDESAGAPNAWQWTFPGGNPASSTVQNPSVTYPVPGVYSVTLEATNLFGSNTATRTNYIQVLDVPTAGFLYAADQLTVTFTNTSTNGLLYAWNFGDGSTSTEANPTHIFPAPGTYTVDVTAVNNCGASTFQQTITLTSGTDDLPWLQQFRLYPNPNTGRFTVEMLGDKGRGTVDFALYDALGRLVRLDAADFNNGNLKKQFDYHDQPAGLYTLRIRSGESTLQVKVVIQR